MNQNPRSQSVIKNSDRIYTGMPVRIISETSKFSGQKAEVVDYSRSRVNNSICRVGVKVYTSNGTRTYNFSKPASLVNAE